MIKPETLKALEKYGVETICYTLDGKKTVMTQTLHFL